MSPVAAAPAIEAACGEALAARRIPGATCRLQLHAGFGFDAARQVAPYLARLGITDLYVSPIHAARMGSTHGYDVTDVGRWNPELGDAAAFERFAATLAAHGLGLVVDFVPNHMGVDDPKANRWWWDVLENGACSRWARCFDIDWSPPQPELDGRVLLPILPDAYGVVLERGGIALVHEDGAFEIAIGERRLPVNPRRVPMVLRHDLEALRGEHSDADPDVRELLAVIDRLEGLPATIETDPAAIAAREQGRLEAGLRLRQLVRGSPAIARHVAHAVQAYQGTPGVPGSFDLLHALLEAQPYRLAFWRTAAHEINWRRFFDMNELAGLRMEDPEVFDLTHAHLLGAIGRGEVTGVRVDHVDGLADPAGYLERLQQSALEAMVARRLGLAALDPAGREAVAAWRRRDPGGEDRHRPLYVVVEKILSPGEALPPGWAAFGTTGYDFLAEVNGLFVDPRGERPLESLRRRVARAAPSFDEAVDAGKRLVLATALASERDALAWRLLRLARADRRTRDLTLGMLRDAVTETITALAVYRTYLDHGEPAMRDRHALESAFARARARNPAMDAAPFAFLHDVLLPAAPATPRDGAFEARRRAFVRRFQQVTGPVQARGVEDTAFYRHVTLASLTEVGSDPRRFGVDPERFHALAAARAVEWPHAMLATATHDTKRGEDARLVLDVLSELPREWSAVVAACRRRLASARTEVDGAPAPDGEDELTFLQALLAAWPAEAGDRVPPDFPVRLQGFMQKAVREAKRHTSWIRPHERYEQAVRDYVTAALEGRPSPRVLAALLPFQRRAVRAARVHSLAQLAIKLAAPGVPDLYQGAEGWDLCLVDPDNRRAVDFAARERALAELAPALDPGADSEARAGVVSVLLASADDGRIKQLVTAAGLGVRRRHPALFRGGGYRPLVARGARAGHVVAFARTAGEEAVLLVVPRLVARFAIETPWPLGPAAWRDTAIALDDALPDRWRDALTGRVVSARQRTLALAELFGVAPLALLERA